MRIIQRSILVIICCVALFQNKAWGQLRNNIGITAMYAVNNEVGKWHYGLQYELLLNEKYGFESGLYYWNFDLDVLYQTPTMSGITNVQLHYLWMPFLLKRHTRFVNIAFGATLQKYIGWTESNTHPAISTSVNYHPKYEYGLMAKLGHSFHLSDKIIFEPELSINQRLNVEALYSGFSFTVKYQL